MPLYEYRKNAENRIPLGSDKVSSIVVGSTAACRALLQQLQSRVAKGLPPILLIDGWYGVDWKSLRKEIESAAAELGLKAVCQNTSRLYRKDLADYRKKFVGDDPSFGWVNSEGTLADVLDEKEVRVLAEKISSAPVHELQVVLGPGSACPLLAEKAGLVAYADFTMQPTLWQMWGGELVPLGQEEPDKSYSWKQYYYCDFYLLLRQKKTVFPRMDFYIEAVQSDSLKLMPRDTYETIIDELVKRPIKQVKITQPGPWGSYRFKDIYDEIPGLENMAWNELAGIELSILVDAGLEGGVLLNMPCQNPMQRPVQMVGQHIHETYPDLLPLQVWLDDGYFAEPVPYERGSMPIHNHPDSAYNKRNFNEPLGRYETYYIVEAYRDAGTMMGFKEDADLEEYERLCRESNNRIPFDWQKFVKRWDTNVGDLFLIPPGTEHGHGGNQMILEMDTGPSVAGTEYSFFTYDFARHTWDDTAKSMTAPPMKMHLEHSFRNNKWRREKYVQEHLRARPVVIDGDGDTRQDRFSTISEMPFEIERFVFSKPMRHTTDGRFLQIPTLTVGKKVVIRSLSDPSLETTLDFLQACLVPAGFGDYEFINPDGTECTIVMIRLKNA